MVKYFKEHKKLTAVQQSKILTHSMLLNTGKELFTGMAIYTCVHLYFFYLFQEIEYQLH